MVANDQAPIKPRRSTRTNNPRPVGPINSQPRIFQQPNTQQDLPNWSEPKINKRSKKNKSLPDLPISSVLLETPQDQAQPLVSEGRQRGDSSIPDRTADGSRAYGPEAHGKPRLRKPASQSTLRSTSDGNEKADDLGQSHYHQVTATIEVCRGKVNHKVRLSVIIFKEKVITHTQPPGRGGGRVSRQPKTFQRAHASPTTRLQVNRIYRVRQTERVSPIAPCVARLLYDV